MTHHASRVPTESTFVTWGRGTACTPKREDSHSRPRRVLPARGVLYRRPSGDGGATRCRPRAPGPRSHAPRSAALRSVRRPRGQRRAPSLRRAVRALRRGRGRGVLRRGGGTDRGPPVDPPRRAGAVDRQRRDRAAGHRGRTPRRARYGRQYELGRHEHLQTRARQQLPLRRSGGGAGSSTGSARRGQRPSRAGSTTGSISSRTRGRAAPEPRPGTGGESTKAPSTSRTSVRGGRGAGTTLRRSRTRSPRPATSPT